MSWRGLGAWICLAWLSGCACTERRGLNGLIVDVTMPQGLPAGDYAFVARVEGAEIRQDWPFEGGAHIFDGDVVVDGRTLFLDVFVTDTTSGFLDVGFREGSGPEIVTIELWRDAAIVAQHTYTPDYETIDPNGAHCGGDVDQAHDTFEVPE